MNQQVSKTIVVTGGTSGIGRATTIMLAAQGHKVIATGLFDQELDDCSKDPLMAGVDFVKLDVCDEAKVRDIFSGLEVLHGLVNCAGVGRSGDEFASAGFSRTMEINLNGTMHCCYAAKDLLAVQGGAIVNIGSLMSFFGSATAPAYSASKGAVLQFSKSLAAAWAVDGIRVNAVAPGWIATRMTEGIQHEDSIMQKVKRAPMGRWGQPEDIANGIEFLLSEKAAFITGIILPIDGGYSAV